MANKERHNIHKTLLTKNVTLEITDKEPSTFGYISVKQNNIGGHKVILGSGLEGDIPIYYQPNSTTIIMWICLTDIVYVYSELSPNYIADLQPGTGGGGDLSNYYTKAETDLLLENAGGLENSEFLKLLSTHEGYLKYNNGDVSVAYADESGHSSTSDTATTAGSATTAEYADEAGHALLADYALNAERWNNLLQPDYIDQPVRTTDNVKFLSVTSDTVNSTVYVSGFTGSGYRINADGSAEFDSLSVRKDLNVNVINIREITGTGGSLAITSVGKIHTITENSSAWICGINTDDNTIAVQFKLRDIVRCQVWDGKGIKYYSAVVIAVSTNSFTLSKTGKSGSGMPAVGDTLFQFGNETNTARQGLIYITNSDTGSPYIDILDGINSDSLVGKTKVRLGKLDGLNIPEYPSMVGYGMYGENVYLKNGHFIGSVTVTGGNAETATGAQDKANAATTAAKAYADAQDVLRKTEIEAYADGIVTAEEQRAIQDATDKLNAAKAYAEDKADEAELNALMQGKWTKIYNVNTSTILPLLHADNTPFDPNYSYEITAKTTSTGTNTTFVGLISNNGAGIFSLEILDQIGASSNHPKIFLDGNVPSVTLYGHTTKYPVEVETIRWLGRKSPSKVNDEKTAAATATANAARDYINNVLPTSLSDLQNQIDGVIESFFYNYNPTSSNIPASTWTTTALKEQHANDTFTNTSTGASWKWVKVGTVWQWQVITDVATQKALALAGTAKDTADSKRRVFIVTPTTPYDIGDLWSQGTSGDLMRCSVARLSGSYVAGDWIKASKYTDDTVANAAQTAASNAQTSANTANTELAKIANDNLLTPSEKQDILKEWQIIQGEQPTVIAQAGTYSIATTAYTNAYNALNTYITPLVASLTTDSVIVGTTFRTNFKTYYDAKVALLKLISDKAKTLADAAQTAANTADGKAVVADGKAVAAQTAASNAQTTANTATTNANTANALLADIALDTKLTAVEKKTVLKEWDIIQSERTVILAQATSYSIATTTYTNAYNALSSYITPLLTNFNTTSNIVATTFRNNFKAYYDAKIALLKLITDKAKSLADTADGKAVTADGKAVAAQTAANNAQTSANTAITNAATANTELAKISNDNLLTPSEKQDTKKEWDIITGERAIIIAQADTYGVTTTAYTNAYSTLETYITPLLSNLTTDSVIVGNTFRSNFKNYYDVKVGLLKLVSDAAKGLVDDLDARTGNLVNNPAVTGVVKGWSATGLSVVNQTFEGVSIPVLQSSVSGDTQNYSNYFQVDPSKAYEVSIWLQKSVNGQYYFGLNTINKAGATVPIITVNNNGVVSSAANTNPYFNSGTVGTTWVKFTGYIMPAGTDPITMKDISNVSTNMIMRADTDKIRLRFLNWGNAGTTRQLWAANPKVVEVDSNMFRNVIAKDTNLRADLRLTSPLPTSLTLDADGVTAKTANSSNYARLDHRGLYVQGGAIDIRTSATANRGVSLDAQGISGFDISGVKSFSLDSTTGEIFSIKGSIGGFTIGSNSLSNTSVNTSLLFTNLSSSANCSLKINETPQSPVLDIRNDQSGKDGISITTYNASATGLRIINNTPVNSAGGAIISKGSHEFLQRLGGDYWNAPGILLATRLQYLGTQIYLNNTWTIAPIFPTIAKTTGYTLRLTHNLGHTNYNTQISIGGGRDLPSYQQNLNYVDIGFASDSNSGVDIMIIGRNRPWSI